MSRRTRIEWWTGVKLGYETADELGIGEFTGTKRTQGQYLDYAKRKQQRIDDRKQVYRLWRQTGDPRLYYSFTQSVKGRYRCRFWRSLGYPNLRRAWAARRRNCARAREEKTLLETMARQRRELERYGL